MMATTFLPRFYRSTEGSPAYHLVFEDSTDPKKHRVSSGLSLTLKSTFYIILYLTTILIAFMGGRRSTTEVHAIPFATISQNLRYNRTFAESPNNLTNIAWASIYPKFGTFFTHAPAIPHRSTLSVFHQLHCLDGIRHAYWQAMDAALSGIQLTESDFPMMSSPPHVRHCIDLIRQSLMCNADLTIEVKDEKGGVLGFGTEHSCKDWGQLIAKIDLWNQHVGAAS